MISSKYQKETARLLQLMMRGFTYLPYKSRGIQIPDTEPIRSRAIF